MRIRYALGRIEYLERNEITIFVVIKNDARLVLITFVHGSIILKHYTQRIRPHVISDFH